MGLLVFAWLASAAAALELGTPFADHMVLQQQKPVPVWGWAGPGETVTVEFAGQIKQARAGADRRWELRLNPLLASTEARVLLARGEKGARPIEVRDVLVGEVWLCGGQSNMERLLGATGGQPIAGRDEAIATADWPLIRQLAVARSFSLEPKATARAEWTVCSPATAGGFTAVGFFFARELFRSQRVPVGIINSSYGGSAAEAWMRADATKPYPEIYDRLAVARAEPAEPTAAHEFFRRNLERWFETYDSGTREHWENLESSRTDWKSMELPAIWEQAGYPAVDGVGWFEKRVALPSDWRGRDLELSLGVVDDGDTTWVNGHEVGTTYLYGEERRYRVPATILREGENVITVRILDFANDGGFMSQPDALRIGPVGHGPSLGLAGSWKFRFSLSSIEDVPIPPQEPSRFGIWVPGHLYNSMIAPLVPYALRGITFYQGETNTGHAQEYRTLFPALIRDWRAAWGETELPFLFVQIAPYRSSRPELREAQLAAWSNTPHTAMVVTSDCTDANDIHPPDKVTVGARLALAARAMAYGESVEYSGPVCRELRSVGSRARLSFAHLGGGLVARGGPLRSFEIAGGDGVYRPARAEIVGDEIEVSAADVPAPVAVRYAWANVPDGNLYNRAGLPASSFRVAVK